MRRWSRCRRADRASCPRLRAGGVAAKPRVARAQPQGAEQAPRKAQARRSGRKRRGHRRPRSDRPAGAPERAGSGGGARRRTRRGAARPRRTAARPPRRPRRPRRPAAAPTRRPRTRARSRCLASSSASSCPSARCSRRRRPRRVQQPLRRGPARPQLRHGTTTLRVRRARRVGRRAHRRCPLDAGSWTLFCSLPGHAQRRAWTRRDGRRRADPSAAAASLRRPVHAPERTRTLTPPSWPADRPLRAWQQAAVAGLFSPTPARLPRLRDARRGQDDVRAPRRAPDALRGPRRRASRVVAPTTHICRQWAADAARYGIDLEPNRPNAAGPEPRDRHGVAVTYQTLAAGPGVHRRRCAESPDAADRRRAAPHGRAGRVGPQRRSTAFAARALPAAALGHAVPLRQHRRSRGSPTTTTASRSADYAYGYTDALLDGVCRPVTFHTYDGDMEWMSDGRRRTRRLRRRPARRRGRAPPAHRARPRRRLDRPRAARRRRPARPTCAPATHPDAGGLVIAADKEHAERLADRLARDRRRARPRSSPPTRRTPRARIARFAAGSGALARVGADGLRGRRHPAPARRRLRDHRAHRAVLPPGRRALHPPHAGAARADEPRVPALRPDAQAARGRDRGGAQPRARRSSRRASAVAERAERARAGRGRSSALWSSARRDDDVLQTTQPGEALQLFADAAAPSPALAAFGARTTTPPRRAAVAPRPRPRSSSASACATSAARSSPRCRAPHRRGAPRDPRARQPRRRARRRSTAATRRAARAGQPAARAQTRLTSASWPKTTGSTHSRRSSSTTSRCTARGVTSTPSSSTRRSSCCRSPRRAPASTRSPRTTSCASAPTSTT